MSVLLWLKRDLRVQDHPALAHAAGFDEPVIPLYVIEPDYWALPDTSARQWAFTRECLIELSKQFSELGAPLVVRCGDAIDVLRAICSDAGVSRIVSHEETGNLWTFERDKRVAAWARGAGIVWHQHSQCGVQRPGQHRDGWARRRDGFMRQPLVATPKALPPHSIGAGEIPDLDLNPDPCPEGQFGGRTQGLSLLSSFLHERGQSYRRAMSSPLQGAAACSRLSPHIALGSLSLREVVQAGQARKAEAKGTRTGWLGAMRSFSARLAWRDHFIQKLEDEPQIEHRCLHSAYEDIRPVSPDQARLEAWAQGETGVPFVDACMRSLRATGWLNFRMRAMVTSFASYHLWLDWRSTGPILARYFTDYEPGIHWSQIQMQSGTTGMNTVRIYNPIKQGHDQDPDGVFTRRWCPELAGLPDRHLQTPWKWERAGQLLGRDYPEPIVDLKTAAKFARDTVWAVRKSADFRAEAAGIIDKHASRKDRQNRFVNDRAPKRTRLKVAEPAQLKLDL